MILGSTRRPARPLNGIAALWLAVAVTACASPSSTTSRASTTSSRTAVTSAPRKVVDGAPTVTVTNDDKGKTIEVHRGDRVTLTLSSTYWTIGPSSDASVLSGAGPPTISPQVSGCVPGQGCGTATARFTAGAPGTATVAATRTSCGEAMGCTAASGSFAVTIRVT